MGKDKARVDTKEYVRRVIKNGRIRLAPFYLVSDDDRGVMNLTSGEENEESVIGQEFLDYEKLPDPHK